MQESRKKFQAENQESVTVTKNMTQGKVTLRIKLENENMEAK